VTAADGDVPALSVVLPTTQPWPEVRAPLERVIGEARELGAEVLVVTAHGDGHPDPASYPGVTWVVEEGASVFRLRSLGMARARGEVVALTEDHCLPWPGWCRGHLAAHREHPEVAIVGGPVGNGARGELSAWASFLLNHAPFMPPLATGETAGVDRSNVSYKRRALPATASPDGHDEPFVDEDLRRRGERSYIDGTIGVDHVQAFGLRGTLRIHFLNGRAVAGLRIARGLRPWQRLMRIVGSPAAAPLFAGRALAAILRHRPRLPARALASVPLLVVVAVVTAAGVLVGNVAGGGDSARHLR
jgi:hypothetical protein